MKKILIIAPHYPPSNLASVHRTRLFAQHLPSFGWSPVILTVAENYYEEALDWDLCSLLPQGQRIEKVKAVPVSRPRLIGDIGLRAFFQLRRKARELVINEPIDFVYIPIPSFYAALIGPYLHRTTGVKYGIDYIDPWVHQFPGSEKWFSRHWWSTKLSRFLEPIAVRKASLITGVAENYYKGVRERNQSALHQCLFGAMPYGSEEEDHRKVTDLGRKPYLFEKKTGCIQLVYAGALLPKAFRPLEELLKTIKKNSGLFADVEFHFIGTGKHPNDKEGYAVKRLAEKYGLWQRSLFEYPARIPYMDVLVHLAAASGIFILGSTEPHYTPSKIYQAILSEKPIWALLHPESGALHVLKNAGAGIVMELTEANLDHLEPDLVASFENYLAFVKCFSKESINKEEVEKCSAREVTKKLSALLDKISD